MSKDLMTSLTLLNADALDTARTLETGSVDLICTDPPYSSLEKHRSQGTTTRLKKSKGSSNEWFPTISDDLIVASAVEWLRVLKPGRHLYVFCDPTTSYALVPRFLEIGWLWGNRLIWAKGWIGTGWHYRRFYEDVLFFTSKPRPSAGFKKRQLHDKGMADLLAKPEYRALKGKRFWPTEKPVNLLRDLITQSTEPGELVFDPYCGSGSTGEAALSSGRSFIGSDVQEDAFERSERRLAPFLDRPAPPEPAAVPKAPETPDAPRRTPLFRRDARYAQ